MIPSTYLLLCKPTVLLAVVFFARSTVVSIREGSFPIHDFFQWLRL